MWYAVETVFIDGEHFASQPIFRPDTDPDSRRVQPGTCLCSEDEAPHNKRETFLDGRIEVHCDWFQTKEQALEFCAGRSTYQMTFCAQYRPRTRSTIRSFVKWEMVEIKDGIEPYRGVYKDV